ncbi:MAG: PorV/PorQ family protein [bacterium]|nr:PorV/PorQ family protein [bacterium]
MKKIICCLIVFLAINGKIYAGSAGTSGAAFLKILPGVRAQAMGGAYTALAEGVSGIHWNPAGIAFSGDKEFSALYMKWIADINYGFLGYAQPVGSNVTLGFTGIYLTTKIEGRDTLGQNTGDINFNNFAGTINYSYLFSEESSWGVNLRYIKEDLDSDKIKALAYDVGYLSRFMDGKFRLGFAVQNLGGKIGLDKKDDLPLNYKAGIAILPWKDKLAFAFDGNFPNDAKQRYNIGLEYCPADLIALRCGYRLNYDQKGMDAVSFGLGIVHKSESRIGYIDIAYLPYGELGDVYKVSYTIQF